MNDVNLQRDAHEIRRLRGDSTPTRMSIWRRLVWLSLCVAVVAALGWWIQSRPTPPPRAGRFSVGGPMPVVPATVQKGDIAITLNALGTVTPFATVTVKTQISGQLTQIAFQEGQTVRQGDLLAEIDSRPYLLALDQAQGQLARDQALLRNAQVDVTRYRTLAAQNSIAQQQVDTQVALVRQYEGTVRTDQAQVDSARLNIIYCHIVAPVSGRVGLRQVDAGNYVQTSDSNGIVVITQVQPITVIFTVPEDNLPAIMKRLRSGATLQVTAYDRGQKVKLATGKLVTVDNQVDTSTGTVKLKAQFDNEDESLFPNQFVTIQLLVDVLQDATVIPVAALQRGAPGTYVYAIKPDNTVTVQPVKLGPAEAERVAVQSGVAPGDRVVVDGADKLRDGAKITLPEAGGAAPSEAPGTEQQRQQRRRREGQ
ncbi:MAG: MdtA/MuxA family multidrug efflux RND transporter periplasmic adaptor subunit [Proteobacteria bacterium]|nr:MdtA/MuxA family multidrug efflux RND transporter periplasmic adaptor subunit [Pseudomonadota bacterium]